MSGHADNDLDSPAGIQYGVLVVPKVFADEAIAQFPTLCTKLTESELATFWNQRAHKHEPDEIIDERSFELYDRIEKAGGTLTPLKRQEIKGIRS